MKYAQRVRCAPLSSTCDPCGSASPSTGVVGLDEDDTSVKVIGLAQNLGQLEADHREAQSKYWANLNLLDQRCNFYAGTAIPHCHDCARHPLGVLHIGIYTG